MSCGSCGPFATRPFTVTKTAKETGDTFTLTLASGEPDGGFMFAPGQFNMLYLFGVGEVPISISGDPADGKRLVHTIRAVGSVTGPMKSLKKGDVIGVRGPYGSAWPVEEMEGSDVVIMCGGVGLAPLRSVIYHIIRNREKYGRVALLYGARTPDDILYRKELEKWRASLELEILVTVDRGLAGWKGNVGLVTTLVRKATFDPRHTHALICGPEVMMRFSVMELAKIGVSHDNVWLSMERNMKCGVGLCGRCQMGPFFVCKDGPVFRYPVIKDVFGKREV
jgi:NAD(P)H-flavin reductase